MGRKPNSLVLEFFERGDKLEDHSNRYQFTCKNCGDFFAKGRIDSLLGHVQKKCPNVTPWDRDRVAFHQQNNSQASRNAQINQSAPETNTMMAFNGFQNNQPDLVQYELPLPPFYSQQDSQGPFYSQTGQSALETLAEVSRQHLDYSSQRPPYGTNAYGHDQDMLGADQGAEQALISELNQHVHQGEQSQQAFANAVLASSALTSSPLVQTASAANHHLEHSQVDDSSQHTQNLDPNLDSQQHEQPRVSPPKQQPSQAQGSNVFTWQQSDTGGKPTQSFGSLTVSMPSNDPDPDLSLAQDTSKSKARSRFNDNRRKQVQSIRKQGACIRCRMLKKPCSEGTPCQTCSNVDSARLWKGKCLRTRLADEFTLYSTSLFHAQAQLEVLAEIESLQNDILPGQVEAKIFPAADISMSFHMRRYASSGQNSDSEPILVIQDSELHEGGTGHEKVERYFSKATEACIESEQSQFLKATLQQAVDLSRKSKEADVGPKDKNATRASYNLQDKLLDDIISLCVATNFLTRPHDQHLELFYQGPSIVQKSPTTGELEDIHADKIPIDQTTLSHRLITRQLLAATETLCSKLGKLVMNELERRLLQRQQASAFATIIASTLLLSCVERMCGLYTSSTPPAAETDPATTPFSTWPLDTPPQALIAQGPRFSDLLLTLLRMRALPPRTVIAADGTLRVRQDNEMPVQFGGRATKVPEAEEVELYVQWLDPLGLSARELMAASAGTEIGGGEGGGEVEEGGGVGGGGERWDMRFVADVLLPQRPAGKE
ncbi:hypothetical protein MBLNU230_g1050t1 [Neophaeotheca triangularis]